MYKRLDSNIAQSVDEGLTLLELIVAIFVMALGTLAVLSAVDQSGTGIMQERARLLAGVVADNRAEELRLPIGGLPAEVNMGGLRFAVTQDLQPTEGGFTEATIRARVVDGAGGPGALRITWIAASNARPGQ
ncbi:type II secretion system protein [Shimia haliotis]|uniref:Type II secretion system protein I n=1 Tax=Shimia haliotis TaxID=1280847 RepID=A0A1I4EKX0_9RHOB|nr:type II secretion system protein [Shimia haliotis]SFL05187.1 type II secretion system protein I [Shimia haliotis]